MATLKFPVIQGSRNGRQVYSNSGIVRTGCFLLCVAAWGLCAAGVYALEDEGVLSKKEARKMKLTSPEFENNQFIPVRFTCEGEDTNPALFIDGIPAQAMSLALIVDDPDASVGTWVHWVAYDIPVTSHIREHSLPGTQGVNNLGQKTYHGPCPPSGTHRYFFKIYALDTRLDLPPGASKGELEKAMKGHILDKTELIGLYKKGAR